MGTGVVGLLWGGESRTGMYGVAQTRTRLLGRRTLRPRASCTYNYRSETLIASAVSQANATTSNSRQNSKTLFNSSRSYHVVKAKPNATIKATGTSYVPVLS